MPAALGSPPSEGRDSRQTTSTRRIGCFLKKKDLLGGVFAASALTVAGTASADMVALLLPENVNPRWEPRTPLLLFALWEN